MSWRVFLTISISTTLALVSAQTGFLSLDCGGTESYEDEYGIKWTPDDPYIKTGVSASVSGRYFKSITRYLQRVRYFPQPFRKHCYALPVVLNETYLLRAGFYYGNYDGYESPTVSFDILIGATYFYPASVPLEVYWYYEFAVKSVSDTIDLCMASNSEFPFHIPFISAIELRKYDTGMYAIADGSRGLILHRRFDLGSTPSNGIRYPVDKFDRIWTAFSGTINYNTMTATSTVSPGETPDQPPSRVMQTAITSNGTLVFNYPVFISNEECHLIFYFAELTTLGKNNTREFFLMVRNGSSQLLLPLLEVPLDILKMPNGSPFRAVEISRTLVLNQPVFFFVPAERSTYGPLVNAVELFLIVNQSSGTELADRRALASIQSHFNLSGWSGDPCLPIPYTWSWITCDITLAPARIIELNLSNHQLHGVIPPSLADLVHLTKIYLAGNSLEGPIPDLHLLKNLTTLHLQNNKLNGKFPSFLLNIPSLRNLYIQNNSFDCVPAKLATNYSTSRGLFTLCTTKPGTSGVKVIVGATVGSFLLLVLFLLLSGMWFYRHKKNLSHSPTTKSETASKPVTDPETKLRSFNFRSFSYDEIVRATNSFEVMLGRGGFGPVYYGLLLNGMEVAVKVNRSGNSLQGEKEFYAEIDILSKVHHKNVVEFLGFCIHDDSLILVYEYLSNGTLRNHLYGSNTLPPLSWKTRLEIAIGTAQGLEYLHTACTQHIIHRDIKTTNILLSSSMVAKVVDFGLSKLKERDASHVSTLVKGTRGYLDPEYHAYGRLTDKSDVYSFGVVLFEIVCGREPINLALPEGEAILTRWASAELSKGNLKLVVDSKLENHYSEQSASKVLELARSCVALDSRDRPRMTNVVNGLKEALSLEESRS